MQNGLTVGSSGEFLSVGGGVTHLILISSTNYPGVTRRLDETGGRDVVKNVSKFCDPLLYRKYRSLISRGKR